MQKILFAMPSYNWVIPVSFVDVLLKLEIPKWVKLTYKAITRSCIHSARNVFFKYMLDEWFDYILMCDDDNIPEINVIEQLLENNKDIVTWIIRGRIKPFPLCIYKKVPNKEWFYNYRPYDTIDVSNWYLVEVDNTWSWCVLIKREVCEKLYNKYMEMPFESRQVEYVKTKTWEFIEFNVWIFDRKDIDFNKIEIYKKNIWEDILFFDRCQREWYKIYCDTRVQLRHQTIPWFIVVWDKAFTSW